ncbi:MAG TPA: hypothetical protein VGN37_27235 [Actinocatenispora sp.]
MTSILTPEHTADERKLAILQASSYLDSLNMAGEYDPNIADKDGLVTYINATTNEPPPELIEERKKVSQILEGLTGIVTAAVLATAGEDDKAKHRPDLWKDPVMYGLSPFISGYQSETTEYHRTVQGVEVATQFLNILMAAVVDQGAALSAFAKFLEGQGATIKLKGSNTEEGYKYACIGMVHELFQVENEEWIYTPKIRMYFTEFTRKTFNITSSCASYQKISFDFKVQKFVVPFKIETWRQDQGFRTQVDDFIKKYTKAQIGRSENYFDKVFQSSPAPAF